MAAQDNAIKWDKWVDAQNQNGTEAVAPPSIRGVEDLHKAAEGAARRFMRVAQTEFDPPAVKAGQDRYGLGSRMSVEKYGRPIWFRGDSDWLSKYALHPTVYRENVWPRTKNGQRSAEKWMLSEFIMKAVSRHPNCPRRDELARWLCLARHWGLPTRLLDWSESIMNAAWFATHDERKQVEIAKLKLELKKEEGECVIWALAPAILNRVMVRDGPFHFLERLREFVFAAFGGQSLWDAATELYGPYPHKWPRRLIWDDAVNLKEWEDSVNSLILAVWAPQVDPRMLAQHAAYTVHGDKTDLSRILKHDRFLIKFQIDPAERSNILQDLRRAGTRESAIFPDLGHLAADIEEEWREIVARVDGTKSE